MNTHRHLLNRYDWGGWNGTPHVFYKFLNIQQATILAHLINVCSMEAQKGKDDDGWCYAPVKSIERMFPNDGEWKIRAAMKNLVAKGYLETKVVGQQRKHFVRPEMEAIDLKVQNLETAESKTWKPRTFNNSITYPTDKFNNTVRSQASRTASEGFLSNGKHATPSLSEKLALKLQKALAAKNKITTRGVSISKWANEFNKLLQAWGKDEVKQVLEGYCAHIGERFMPLAFCAASFREKFKKIENRLEVIKEEQGEQTAHEIHYEVTDVDEDGNIIHEDEE
jgi:hypothetical protein